jgi:hypothetical protein
MPNSIAMHGTRAGFCLVISAFFLVMLSIGHGRLSIEVALFSLLVCAVLTVAGELTLRACHLRHIKAWLPMSFIVGYAAISLPMMALALMANWSGLTVFFISALGVLLGLKSVRLKGAVAPPAASWADIAMTGVCAVSIGLLAKVPVASVAAFMETGVLPIWSDYFLHGVTISAFGSPFATGMDMELAGVNRVFYHYASFMLPSAVQAVFGISGLALSTAFFLPFGLLMAALGSYVLAVELGGRLVGLLTFVVIIALPASSVLVESGWFEFYWLLFAAPGSGYAMGVSAAVCVALLADVKKHDGRVLALALLLMFSLILIRVHMFILLAPAVLAFVGVYRWCLKPRLLAVLALGMMAAIMLLLHFSIPLYTLWVELTSPFAYLNTVLGGALVNGLPLGLVSSAVGLTMFYQMVLVLVAVLGVYSVLYPAMLMLSVRRFGFVLADVLPVLVLLSFIGLMLFVPTNRTGDFTDYKQRHFLLLYVLVVTYTVYYAVQLVSRHISDAALFKRAVVVGALGILVGNVWLNWGLNPARPNMVAMSWASALHNQVTSPGLIEAAEYIRAHARQGDVIAMDVPSIGTMLGAPIIELVSLTDVPAYIARPEIKMKRSVCVKNILLSRLRVLETLSAIDNWPETRKWLQTNGVRWFVVPGDGRPKWDVDLKAVAFSSKGMSVYDAGHSANDLFSQPQC